MIENTDLATSWLQALAARGVTVTIRNNRIRLHPIGAYQGLTDDERATLRHHREAIKTIVRAGFSGDVASATPIDPVGKAAPKLDPAADLDAWRAIHWNDASEIERRNKEATAVMLHQVGKPSPY